MSRYISIFIIFFFIYIGPTFVFTQSETKNSNKTSDSYSKIELSDTNIIDIGSIEISPKRTFSSKSQNSEEVHEAFLLDMGGNREKEISICDQNIRGQNNKCDKNRSKDGKKLIRKNKNCSIDKKSCC